MPNEPTKPPASAQVTSSYLNHKTPGVYVTEGAVTPPQHGVAVNARVKSNCEMAGLDLIDEMVMQIGVIRDNKGADITEQARTKLQNAWSATIAYTWDHQRAVPAVRVPAQEDEDRFSRDQFSPALRAQTPQVREVADSLELISRLRDSRDTMSAMMGLQGVPAESLSAARRTLHTEVMARYDVMIHRLVHCLWGHQVSPAASADKNRG